MVTCIELAVHLPKLQNTLTGLQAETDDPEGTCAAAGLTGEQCMQYIRSLEGQVASVERQIVDVQRDLSVQGCPISPITGSDGATLAVRMDSQGHLTWAEAFGRDRVKHSFTRTSSFNKNTQGWYYTVIRQEFFENDLRYLYMTTWIYLWGRKVSMSISSGGKDYGFSINFPDDGSHDSTSITIASGSMGQQFDVAQGTLNLNQGSLSAPSFTADFAFPPEIAQQISKTSYFRQLFNCEQELCSVQETADMQAAGINPNMTLNEALYGQRAGQAAIVLRPLGGGGGFRAGLTAAKAACWVGGALVGALITANPFDWPGGGPVLGIVVGQAAASVCSDAMDALWSDESPPPSPSPVNPDMSPMPPDASVPMDDGSPWDGGNSSDGGGESGGDSGSGGSSPRGICLPSERRRNVVVPFLETTGNCL